MSDEPFKFDKKVRLIELFAGIGSQAKSLERLGVDFEHYKVVEFDKYAIKSYNAIHGTDFETSDITKISAADLQIVDTDSFTYLLTYSFPCQDLSVAGKQKGMEKGSGTRSGLLWEVERLLDECTELPQVLLMENVPQVHGKKNIDDFNAWISFLESKGYSNFWQDLNAKDYGIPQNRNRTFMVSFLGNYSYIFPEKQKLDIRLIHLLEREVAEKYYFKEWIKIKGHSYNYDDARCIQIGELDIKAMDCVKRVYDSIGLSPTLTNMQGGHRQPKILDLLRIRKLTPLECWRLMGFDDQDYYKAAEFNSNTQLYKQAGNSIVVNVLEAIFKQMI